MPMKHDDVIYTNEKKLTEGIALLASHKRGFLFLTHLLLALT